MWEKDIAPWLHLLFQDLHGEKEIKPSLLHGDLWSGNIGSADGMPSIFDPGEIELFVIQNVKRIFTHTYGLTSFI